MSEVMTEAGRAHLDEWWPNITTDDEPDDYENIDRQDARKAIRAIEDEAARKERERIVRLVGRVGEAVGSILRAGDGRAYDPAVTMRNAIRAAITDTEADCVPCDPDSDHPHGHHRHPGDSRHRPGTTCAAITDTGEALRDVNLRQHASGVHTVPGAWPDCPSCRTDTGEEAAS